MYYVIPYLSLNLTGKSEAMNNISEVILNMIILISQMQKVLLENLPYGKTR